MALDYFEQKKDVQMINVLIYSCGIMILKKMEYSVVALVAVEKEILLFYQFSKSVHQNDFAITKGFYNN